MIYILYLLGAIVIGALCRYAPGFKCVTYCRYKTYRYDKAIKKIRSLSALEIVKLSKKQMVKLYDHSTHFGCKSLYSHEDEITKSRELLKNAIADKELLED